MGSRTYIRKASIVFAVLGLALYLFAKLHFGLAYGTPNYLHEHWPLWLGMAVLGAAGYLLDRLSATRVRSGTRDS